MKLKIKISTALLFWASFANAQFTVLAPIPEPVANNAVVAAEVNGKPYVYSFCGIDSTKIWSGIHLKTWRYDVKADEWSVLTDVPDPDGGKIAAAASFLKGKIYVTGGYHVAQNGGETSSVKVHVFDPMTNEWLPDAASIPTPIDDHVQAVWRDSLIFVVTGWSNTTNVANVQIFNPVTNEWMDGTPVPNNTDYKVFGASGVIIGDTIFYAGGARLGSNFPPTSFFRKGVIEPGNPTQIDWSGWNEPAAKGYRMAAATCDGRAFWLGGSDVTYNFNGIAYNGSGGVSPLDRISAFDPAGSNFFQSSGNMPAIMDLRGAAQISDDEVILAGGMVAEQKVSNLTWRVGLGKLNGIGSNANEQVFYKIYPNPASQEITVETPGRFEVEIYDQQGKLILLENSTDKLHFSTKNLARGTYWLEIISASGLRGVEQIILEN